MAVQKIVNTTGSKLNRYKIKKEDGSIEVVELSLYPGEDFQAGTLLGEASINPIIDALINDVEDIVIPINSVWFQITENTATAGELDMDPNLVNSWVTDFSYSCTENDYLEMIPNQPTSDLGLASYCYTKNGSVRFYACDDLTNFKLKFKAVHMRKENHL
ncbi:hypothetical protein [Anaerorhabdus sp.]|uniref:hypothetical protein n=1 Tax=Anaerorhabdus sp. TaxID=1872524 RepID=UPI002FC598BE